MPVRRSFVAVAIASLIALTFSGGSAGAVTCPPFNPDVDADGKIAPAPFTTYIGLGTFNRSGAGQSIGDVFEPGDVNLDFVQYRNSSNVLTRNLVVQAKLVGDVGSFVVKITDFDNTKDWTAKFLRPEGKKFRNIGPSDSTPNVRIRIKMKDGANPDDRLIIRFRGTYDSAHPCGDTVKSATNGIA